MALNIISTIPPVRRAICPVLDARVQDREHPQALSNWTVVRILIDRVYILVIPRSG